jgi:drug/metabolite transporter (DMT)-like permease
MSMVVLVSLGAALAYALASVFQQYAAVQAPDSDALRMSLLFRLATRPVWLVGILADIGGFVLQFIALGHGSLVLVQPLLVCGLLFALPLGALFARNGLPARSEWVGAAMTVAGLALFLMVANPGEGSTSATALGWTIVTVATAVPAAIMTVVSRFTTGPVRASLQATAAGFVYGLTAAYTKTVAHIVTANPGSVGHLALRMAESWEVYGIVVTGLASMILAQSAFQAGPLGWSLPALTVVDPVVSIIVGAVAFGEFVNSSVPALTVEAVGLVVMAAGVVIVARSPSAPGRAELVDRLPTHADQS